MEGYRPGGLQSWPQSQCFFFHLGFETMDFELGLGFGTWDFDNNFDEGLPNWIRFT